MGWRLLAGREELAGIFRVIRHEEVEEGGEGLCLDLMDVEGVWFDGRYGVTAIVNQSFSAQVFSWVRVDISSYVLQLMEVQSGDVQLPVYALGYSGHLGVAVPVEPLSIGHQHKEKRELGLHLDGQSNDRIRFPQPHHNLIQLGHLDLAHLLDQKVIVLRMPKGLSLKIIIFVGNTPYEI